MDNNLPVIIKKKRFLGYIYVVLMLMSLFMIFMCLVQRLLGLSIFFIVFLLITLYLAMDYAYTPNNLIYYNEKDKTLVYKNGKIKIEDINEISCKRSKDFKGLHFNFGNLYISSNSGKVRFKYVSHVKTSRAKLIYLKHNGRLMEE